jgi:trehalose 6-phosphate phosphatase
MGAPAESPTESSGLPASLRPLAADPSGSLLCLDFDGTLSPIVPDPVGALPLPEVPDLLARLARRFALVAVVSGRPVDFLARALQSPTEVRLVGLYGFETLDREGRRLVTPAVLAWEPVMAEVAAEALAEAPEGIYVEPKGLTVTLHWRRAPEHEHWVTYWAAEAVTRHGVVAHEGRANVELRPPLRVDKGTVLRELAALVQPLRGLAVFGDDVGDLPAFAAAAELGGSSAQVVRVAAVDVESPPEVAAQADLVVPGPPGMVALLGQLADAADGADAADAPGMGSI